MRTRLALVALVVVAVACGVWLDRSILAPVGRYVWIDSTQIGEMTLTVLDSRSGELRFALQGDSGLVGFRGTWEDGYAKFARLTAPR